MVKRIAIASLFLAAGLQALQADQTTVSFDSGNQTVFNQSSTPLSGGTILDGNGTVLQLGYYDGATTANNFLGNWVALSGAGSLNTAVIPGGVAVNPSGETYNQTSIGDLNANGAGNGTFALSLDFVLGNATSGNSLPPSVTIPLALRFYSGTTIANSAFFNVVSDDLWVWKTPSTPPANVTLSLDDLGLEWLSIAQGGAAGTAFHTTIPTAIPEPSTLACLLLGGAGTLALGARRRFKS
jgi:hypothetical protein